MHAKKLILGAAAVAFASTLYTAAPPAIAAEMTLPALVYRTGAYAPNGVPFANGLSDYIALVNSRYRVWDKGGTPLTQEITFNTLFNGVANCQGVFDPFVDYDEANDRFVMGGITVSGGGPVAPRPYPLS